MVFLADIGPGILSELPLLYDLSSRCWPWNLEWTTIVIRSLPLVEWTHNIQV